MNSQINLKEEDEQAHVVSYVEAKMLPVYSIPNGFHVQGATVQAHVKEMSKLKKTGLRTGVPDLCVPVPVGKYHGLYIEMKRRNGGVVSSDQAIWISRLNKLGYLARVCKGSDEAEKLIEDYLKGIDLDGR